MHLLLYHTCTVNRAGVLQATRNAGWLRTGQVIETEKLWGRSSQRHRLPTSYAREQWKKLTFSHTAVKAVKTEHSASLYKTGPGKRANQYPPHSSQCGSCCTFEPWPHYTVSVFHPDHSCSSLLQYFPLFWWSTFLSSKFCLSPHLEGKAVVK